MELFASWFGKKKTDEPTKPVVDPATIVEPVDFFSAKFPYEQGFKEIDAYIRTLPEKGYVPVSDILRLQFYALYKQATLGDIDEKKVKQPSMFRDWEGYWKVVGWRKCKGMAKEKARDFYIELLDAQIRKHSTVKWGATLAEDRWAAFYDGVQRVQNLPKNGYHISDSLRAHVYAMYKQGTVGDLKAFQKSSAATAAKYKWLRARPAKAGFDQLRYDEWKKLDGMSKEHAKRLYCKELFREAAMYGYVWDPPGTEGHLEVVGDQTSAKNFKRMDSETLRKRLWIENPSNDAEAPVEEIEGAGVKLSAVERMALKKFLRKERKELDNKAGDPSKKTASTKEVAAEALEIYKPEMVEVETESVMSELHVDPNENVKPTVAATVKDETKSAPVGIEQEKEENGESSSAEEEKPAAKPEVPVADRPASPKATTSAKEPAKTTPASPKKAAPEPAKAAKPSTTKGAEPSAKKKPAAALKDGHKKGK